MRLGGLMSRSLWKGPNVSQELLAKVTKANNADSKLPIRTWSRSSVIIESFIGRTILVHNGKAHIPVFILPDMVGMKLGALVPTRLFRGHGGDKTVKSKKKGGK